MVNGTAKLIVDLGNSSTRVTTHFGKTSKGGIRRRTRILDNHFSIVPDDKVESYLNSGTYSEEDSKMFEFNGSTYCTGVLCNTEFGSTAIRPTALEKKYESLVTKLTLVNAFCEGYSAIAAFTNSDLDCVDVDWDVTLLLPPDDIDTGAKLLADVAKSIPSISFKMPNLSKEIKVNKVTVYPEGFCALIAVCFESKDVVRKSHAYLLEEDSSTLIVDIGAGTSDIVMSQGCNIVSSSKFTKEVGGNNVHQRVRRLLKEKGIVLSDSAVRKGCEVGYVKSGNKKYNIVPIIASSKSAVAKQLVDAIQEFFENNMIPIQSINNILVCGGGAENNIEEGIEPISNYIIEFMKRLSKDINLVELPKDGEEVVSPRMLNIAGASILSE